LAQQCVGTAVAFKLQQIGKSSAGKAGGMTGLAAHARTRGIACVRCQPGQFAAQIHRHQGHITEENAHALRIRRQRGDAGAQ